MDTSTIMQKPHRQLHYGYIERLGRLHSSGDGLGQRQLIFWEAGLVSLMIPHAMQAEQESIFPWLSIRPERVVSIIRD